MRFLALRVVVVVFALFGAVANAANSNPNYPVGFTVKTTSLGAAANTPVTIATGAAGSPGGSQCTVLMGNSNDQGAAHYVTITVTHGAVTGGLATGNMPTGDTRTNTALGAGVYGVPINFLSVQNAPGLEVGQSGNAGVWLNAGDTIKGQYATALSGGFTIDMYTKCNDYQ